MGSRIKLGTEHRRKKMDKKTIGSFIAALRKSSGLTQKDLADKLGVSDKAVSRWERDDYAPDISLIPVIAEIFGVTSDEILRGERILIDRDRDVSGKPNPKTDKQIERLLKASMDRFDALSIISVGISLLGLLVVMTVNFAFLKLLLAFFVGCVFYLVAMVCEFVFFVLSLSKIDDDEFEGEIQNWIKLRMIRRFGQAISVTVMIFAFNLPMLLMSSDMDFFFEGTKISLSELFLYGTPLALFSGIFCMAVMFFADLALIRTGVYTRTPEQVRIRRRLRRLKGISVAFVAVLILITTGLTYFSGFAFALEKIASPTVFTDHDQAKAYLSQGLVDNGSAAAIGFADPDGTDFFESAYDPEKFGYITIDRDSSTENYRIIVYSRQDTDRADRIMNMIITVYVTLVVIEIIAGFIIYFIRKARVIRSLGEKKFA